ncbi:MAG TPA: hypothetical protein VFT43_00155, partial [Candidatus Polarisedimenticolia bacterium]|nr:hypothetical protein [Candidatus Polarisedimenticolia bacterium]
MRRIPGPRNLALAAGGATLVAAGLLFGLATSLASREHPTDEERFGTSSSWYYFQRTKLPPGHARITGLSPFGDQFKESAPPADRSGLVATSLGYLDLRNPHALDRVPAGLLRKAEIARSGHGGLGGGTNIVQVSAAAIETRGLAAIEAELRSTGRVVGILPERAFVVRTHGRAAMERLGALPFVEAAMPFHPAFKIPTNLGRAPMIQAKRAQSRSLDLLVTAWPGAEAEEIAALRRDVEALVGPAAVGDHAGNGTVLRVQADAGRVGAIAALEPVAGLEENPELVLDNSEAVSTIMTGSNEESLGARPYHDLGLDGGGIDTNGDGRRINDGTDLVPPQLVVVTDNGLSYDSVQFSQTSTFPDTTAFPIGPRHRRVHAIQTVADGGDTCDSVLSGSGTHGNIVAGAIAGYPSQLGVFATKTISYGQPTISGFNLDGVARGARIIMQDSAGFDRCTLSELIEQGGNVVPGNLDTRLREGRDAGDNVHLHVMPFGTPNFDNAVENLYNGTYSLESAQLDTFLVNNRDYMIFVPVGSQGAVPSDVEIRRYPDLFDG